MRIELEPKIEALLQRQVVAGHFATVEEAVTAAILGVPLNDDALGDLTWAAPHLREADDAIAAGKTVTEEEAFVDLERRFGKL